MRRSQRPAETEEEEMTKGIYVSGKYAVTEGGWATDGKSECSANGFIGATRWLTDRCAMPKADLLSIFAQRDADLSKAD